MLDKKTIVLILVLVEHTLGGPVTVTKGRVTVS